ncbi:unnamed protein product [Rhodiola kirilowii]
MIHHLVTKFRWRWWDRTMGFSTVHSQFQLRDFRPNLINKNHHP